MKSGSLYWVHFANIVLDPFLSSEPSPHSFNKVLELTWFVPTKVLCWTEICWLWTPFEYSELIVMLKKPVWDDLWEHTGVVNTRYIKAAIETRIPDILRQNWYYEMLNINLFIKCRIFKREFQLQNYVCSLNHSTC